MRKRLENYLSYMDKLREEQWVKDMTMEEREHLRQEVLVQIGFFQHERMIHLLVTLAFAILSIGSLVGCFITSSIAMIVMTILCLALLIPYVFHYYILENGVQRLYEDYDAVCMK